MVTKVTSKVVSVNTQWKVGVVKDTVLPRQDVCVFCLGAGTEKKDRGRQRGNVEERGTRRRVRRGWESEKERETEKSKRYSPCS